MPALGVKVEKSSSVKPSPNPLPEGEGNVETLAEQTFDSPTMLIPLEGPGKGATLDAHKPSPQPSPKGRGRKTSYSLSDIQSGVALATALQIRS
jgi:hypothetical protein